MKNALFIITFLMCAKTFAASCTYGVSSEKSSDKRAIHELLRGSNFVHDELGGSFGKTNYDVSLNITSTKTGPYGSTTIYKGKLRAFTNTPGLKSFNTTISYETYTLNPFGRSEAREVLMEKARKKVPHCFVWKK